MIEREVERHAPGGARTIGGLLRAAALAHPEAAALVDAGGNCLTYGALVERVETLAARLRGAGVEPGDGIAILLPNGVELALAVLAAACAGIACPLNPAYRPTELEFYFGDVRARALLTGGGPATPGVSLARARGIDVIDVRAGPYLAAPANAALLGAALPEDVALVLHTSGTTARPKMVPLTHANLCGSAASIAGWLGLSPADRCLNVMPLFHIHGLVGALLASLYAGAGVVCSAGFASTEFFTQLREHRATWYSAVPTMHQAILARAPREAPPPRLRFVRSSSAALAPQTARALEKLFRAPLIEAYGMTEAAHQVCSNPLRPGAQRYGSVGLAAGCEVTVVDERGEPLACGRTGEVALRGPSVTRGYAHDPEANARAFVHGRFRTGDLGRFDADGYLYLAGRIKDIINRGGEKIAPREIDEVLLAHPAVAQAVAFAMPDARLGEEVAAAVVLQAHASVTADELQRFVGARLAEFKVPRRIAFVADIPAGPTGKLQRHALASALGFAGPPPNAGQEAGGDSGAPQAAPERSAPHAALERIWCEVLQVPSVSGADDFFTLGGDSLLAARVIARVRHACGRELSMLAFFDRSTLHAMAQAVAESPPATSAGERTA